MNSMWQTCPVCNGQGNNMLGKSCHVCNGHGIISILNGAPPSWPKNQTITSTTTTLKYSVSDEKRMDIIGQNGNEGLHYEREYCSKHGVLFDDERSCWMCLETSNK